MDSAGIQVRELDYSDYVQSASEVSIGCVGGARRGPLTPTLVTSQAEFIKIFGQPKDTDYGAYGALATLTQATKVYYQRVVNRGVKAKAGQAGTDKFTYEAVEFGTESNGMIVSQTAITDEVFSIVVKNNKGKVLETYDKLSANADNVRYITKVVNIDSVYIRVLANETGSIVVKDFTLSGGVSGASFAIAGDDSKEFKFRSKYYDSTLNSCKVLISEEDAYKFFDVTIIDLDGSVLESFSSVSRNPLDDRYVESFINKYSSRIMSVFNKEGTKEASYVFAGGTDRMGDIADTDLIGDENEGTGLMGFNNAESVDINLLIIPGCVSKVVMTKALAVCQNRGDCLFIADSPFGLKAQKTVEWANGTGSYIGDNSSALDSSYGALYHPWIKANDPYNKKDMWLPPSGYVAAQMAYSDAQAHPWFAPAGLNRGIIRGVLGLEYSPSKGDRDVMYGGRNIVNPIVNFVNDGITIWGQKTMQRRTSALDRVNVRRLINYLKKAVGGSTRYYVFEPNDEFTWDRWIDMVESKLKTVKELRGIYDLKVIMAPTTAQIDNYEMPGTIKIKPTKTAEFITIDFMVMPTGVSFVEE